MLVFPGGADTPYLGLGSNIYALLKNPDQLARVVADPEGLCAAAAEEGVRWSPPVPMLPRRNRADVVWNGVAIPAGAPPLSRPRAPRPDPPASPRRAPLSPRPPPPGPPSPTLVLRPCPRARAASTPL